MMKRYFYAVEYAYGATVLNRGNRPDLLKRFTSKAERDAWVRAGNPYRTQAGYREAVSAKEASRIARRQGNLWDGDALRF